MRLGDRMWSDFLGPSVRLRIVVNKGRRLIAQGQDLSERLAALQAEVAARERAARKARRRKP